MASLGQTELLPVLGKFYTISSLDESLARISEIPSSYLCYILGYSNPRETGSKYRNVWKQRMFLFGVSEDPRVDSPHIQ